MLSLLHGASWLWIVPILSLLIFVHELGHFWVARRVGIRVKEFGFGYPPRIFAVRRGETEYSLNWIPVGGFTRMVGEDETTDEGGSFSSKSRGQRAAVLVAGSAMNALLAPVLLTVAFVLGVRVPDRVQILAVMAGSPASEAGLHSNDIILRAGSQEIKQREAFQAVVQAGSDRPLPLVVQREGQELSLTVTPRINPARGVAQVGVEIEQLFVIRSFAPGTALWMGIKQALALFIETWVGFFFLIQQLFSGPVNVDVQGPIGIAQMTGQAARLGLSLIHI